MKKRQGQTIFDDHEKLDEDRELFKVFLRVIEDLVGKGVRVDASLRFEIPFRVGEPMDMHPRPAVSIKCVGEEDAEEKT